MACWYESQKTQNICITFIQRRPNVLDVGSTLYKCHTNVLGLLDVNILDCKHILIKHDIKLSARANACMHATVYEKIIITLEKIAEKVIISSFSSLSLI